VVGAWGNDNLIEKAFRLDEYDPTAPFQLGEFRIRFHEVPHFTTTYAIEFASANGAGRFTYGADCRPSDELVDFARGTDLLMVEATLPRPERTGERGHMTPAEAGEHGRRAGAARMVLTHISDELDQDWALEQGKDTFGGTLDLATEGAVYEV
jgi:ribonuclease BN (tRNA processing enzyme)